MRQCIFVFICILWFITIGCSELNSPITPSPTNQNNPAPTESNPFAGCPVDEPYDNYTISGGEFSIDSNGLFQRNEMVIGLTNHNVVPYSADFRLDEAASIGTFKYAIYNDGEIIYDARVVIDEILPEGSEPVDIDGTTLEGKSFWNFGIIPQGKTSPNRNLSIRFTSNVGVSVKGHIEFKERAYIQWRDLILHTDGFDGNKIKKSPDFGEIVSNEVIAGIPPGNSISKVYKYLVDHNLMLVGYNSLLRCMELKIIDYRNPEDVLSDLEFDSFLNKPDLNHISRICYFPNDPNFDPSSPNHDHRWSFEMIHAIEAWDYYSDGEVDGAGDAKVWPNDTNTPIIMAILDTGLRIHEDLNFNDFDIGIAQKFGINCINPYKLPWDDNGHGTAVAGISGAMGNNGKGIAGVAWNPIFLPIKTNDADGKSSFINTALGLSYMWALAQDNPKCKFIVNMSWGDYSEQPPFWLNFYIDSLNNQPNTILCAAAGNDGNDKERANKPFDISANNHYPAAFNACISVGGSNRPLEGQLEEEWIFSNWGETVDICAPAEDTWTTYWRSSCTYDYFLHTSAATPFVSGTAALIWAKHPEYTKQQVRDAILNNCDPMETHGKALGAGRLNVFKAIGGEITFNPQIVKTLPTTGNARDVMVSNGYAYVANDNSGLQIFDVDPVDAAYLVKTLYPGQYNYGIYVSGDYAYMASGDPGLHIVYINPPESASIIKTVNTPGNANCVKVVDGYAYVSDREEGLQIIDVEPPESAHIVKSVDTTHANGNDVSGGYAYVADRFSGLRIIDVDPIDAAYIVKTVDTPDWAFDVKVKGGYAFVADHQAGGFHVIDIEPIDLAHIVETIETPGTALGVYLQNGYAYVADGSSGLHVIDIHQPETSSIVISMPFGFAYEVYVEDNYAYVASDISGTQIIKLW